MKYPAGSQWRKWDLHIHAPGTKLSDGYKGDLDRYCQVLHDSDVAAFGITDYFSLDAFFAFKARYGEIYGSDDAKVFFPNLELRLPEALNKDGQSVNIHLLFRPDFSRNDANRFVAKLKTELTVQDGKPVYCSDLSGSQYSSATVSRPSIETALSETFGKRADVTDHVLIITSANGDGIRPGGKGSKGRKYALVDEIDKLSDAFFGDPGARTHFLNSERLEGDETIAPKPVFAGCDAHSFEDLENWLGKHVTTEGQQQHIRWIKADPTFAGLQQTLIEPTHRVALGPLEPDTKEPYKVISKVRFTGSEDFPDELVFNSNLNSIIGSRSSGKSALLAFIAHAVDPKETVRQQELVSKLPAGPAAGKTWAEVAHISCDVEWGDGSTNAGKVIYIPQNSLYQISEHPEQITQKIQPALFRTDPAFKSSHEHLDTELGTVNGAIATSVTEWFALEASVDARLKEIADIGDKTAIASVRDGLQDKIDELKKTSELSEKEIEEYQALVGTLASKRARIRSIEQEILRLSPYVDDLVSPVAIAPASVAVSFTAKPAIDQLPESIQADLLGDIEKLTADATGRIEAAIVSFSRAIRDEQVGIEQEIVDLESANAGLIEKNLANVALAKLVADHKAEATKVTESETREAACEKLRTKQEEEATAILAAIVSRQESLDGLVANFGAVARSLDDLTFGIETAFDPDDLVELSHGFKKNELGDYVVDQLVEYRKAQGDPSDFLSQLRRGKQKLNSGFDPQAVAIDVLTATPEIRFTAQLDGDVIGGFSRSSMTPGKQALFALTLILNESQQPWPLLIDQPEDDLDSRSIYDVIVPYMTERKRERQIIMVSHNANLVIGADSEEVIVANRHGDDRRNKDKRTFNYLTGSLEHSQDNPKSKTTLGRFGIREHACEVLDGGAEAFQKRKDKYKI